MLASKSRNQRALPALAMLQGPEGRNKIAQGGSLGEWEKLEEPL